MTTTPVPLPPALAHASDDSVVWQRVDHGASSASVHRGVAADGSVRFLKVARHDDPDDGADALRGERDRLAWLAGRVPVPEVLGWAVDEATGDAFLLTRALPGAPASDPEHLGDVEVLLRTLAAALRTIHDLPVDDCPFDAGLDVRLPRARSRVAHGLVDEDDFEPAYRRYSAAQLLDLVEASVPTAAPDLVVVHGDVTLDNVLFDRGTCSGFVDVGSAGVGDRNIDLAVVARELATRVSPHALGPFFDAYGIDRPELGKIDFYVLLDELL